MNIDAILRQACEHQASDVHLKVGNPPYCRANGDLLPLAAYPRLTSEDLQNMAYGILTERQTEKLKAAGELDMAYGVSGVGRFRVNVFHQRGTLAMALRIIPDTPRSIEQLYLPKVVDRLCEELSGLILVTGFAGSGKSTTLAAMIDRINRTRCAHIITIEDPIEFLHSDKMGFIDQREVEVDSASVARALQAALRQDADVILVSEMRDLETIRFVLEGAETGRLVFSTLPARDALETIERIIHFFPSHEQTRVRRQLVAILRGIIAQRLIRKSDGGGRVPAVEVLVATDSIRDLIAHPESTHRIPEAIAAGSPEVGGQTFDQSLFELSSSGLIALEDALYFASRPGDLELRVAGVTGSPGTTHDGVAAPGGAPRRLEP